VLGGGVSNFGGEDGAGLGLLCSAPGKKNEHWQKERKVESGQGKPISPQTDTIIEECLRRGLL